MQFSCVVGGRDVGSVSGGLRRFTIHCFLVYRGSAARRESAVLRGSTVSCSVECRGSAASRDSAVQRRSIVNYTVPSR